MYRSDSINRILSMDCDRVELTYLQEHIKNEFVYRLQTQRSIPLKSIDRFRNILFSYKWRSDIRNNVSALLDEVDPVDLYQTIVCRNMGIKISFECVDPRKNLVDEVEYDAIVINIDKPCYAVNSTNATNAANAANAANTANPANHHDLSTSIKEWISQNVSYAGQRSYRFKDIPHIVPIIIERNNTHSAHSVYDTPIDIKEAITFPSVNDNIQKMFSWDIHSAILFDRQHNRYSALVVDDANIWHELCDSNIPANRVIDMNDQNTINRIARQVRMVIYKIK